VIAMAYSVFALYASGMEAVLGGMLVLGITYIIWGFLAPRFALPAAAAQSKATAVPGATPAKA
jgi:putrescine:ornithine antiporter